MRTAGPGPSQAATQLRAVGGLRRGGLTPEAGLIRTAPPPPPSTSEPCPLRTENVARILRRKLLEHALRETWRQAATAAPGLGSYSHAEKQRGTTLFRTSSDARTLPPQVGDTGKQSPPDLFGPCLSGSVTRARAPQRSFAVRNRQGRISHTADAGARTFSGTIPCNLHNHMVLIKLTLPQKERSGFPQVKDFCFLNNTAAECSTCEPEAFQRACKNLLIFIAQRTLFVSIFLKHIFKYIKQQKSK